MPQRGGIVYLCGGILSDKNLCPIPAPINISANKSRETTIYKIINLQCSDWAQNFKITGKNIMI